MKNKKILITGAAGFVGFHLSQYLLKNNFKIFGIENYESYYDVKNKKKKNINSC
jgi:UDP-glucuronate 4-epimerase